MKAIQITIFLLFISLVSFSQSEIYSKSGQAIEGYDPVGYFKEEKPVKGNEQYSYQWKGATWYFASKENADLFKSNPEKYAPQYGGYCAYGVAGGYKAPISPDSWTIVDNRLYLNYDKKVQTMWSKERNSMIKKADENWPEVKSKKE